MKILARSVEGLDKIPEFVFLILNLCIAGFVTLAHGGALAITLTGDKEAPEAFLTTVSISLPLAVLIILSSAYGLWSPSKRSLILAIHASILSLGVLAMLIWATSILFRGIPEEGGFSWAPGLMTCLCVYAVYLLRLTVLSRWREIFAIKYLHLFVFVVSFSIDVGVFAKALSEFLSRRNRPPSEASQIRSSSQIFVSNLAYEHNSAAQTTASPASGH